MAGSNHQLIYAMAPQYAAPLQYQYYTAEQPTLALPYSSLYTPPPPLPYDHQGLVGRIKRPAEDGMRLSLPPVFCLYCSSLNSG